MPILLTAALSLSLIAAAVNATFRVIGYKGLERDALLVLTQWQGIDALTNDVLLKRVSLADGGAATLTSEWARRSLEFSLALARFNERRKLAPLGPEVVSDVEGAVALWVLAERRISAAQTSIKSMMNSGLASKVMVNGFLSTFYRMRLEGLLSEKEIVEISDIVSTLEILDTATDQFDRRLRAVVSKISDEVDARILQVSVMSAVLAPSLAALALFLVLSYRRYRKEELRRRLEADRLRRELRHDFMRGLFSAHGESADAEEELRALGVSLPFRESLVLGLFRCDRSGTAAKALPQEALIALLEAAAGPEREIFPVDQEIVAVLLDAADPADPERFLSSVRAAAGMVRADADAADADAADAAAKVSLSVAISAPFSGASVGEVARASRPESADESAAAEDKPHLMEGLLALFAYRYAYGPGALLRACAAPPRMESEYEYPSRTDELLAKRLMEGKFGEARRYIDELLNGAAGYAPATLRAVVARISSAFFSGIERLERAAGFSLPSASTASLAEIVQLDTLKGARDRFFALLEEIERLLARRPDARSGELADRVDAAIAAAFTDPNLSLESIADRRALSAGYLGRLYRKTRGKSVADAINDLRLDAARSRLASTDETIEAIAAQVGVTNPGSFYRLFKARWGMTPAEYREKTRADR